MFSPFGIDSQASGACFGSMAAQFLRFAAGLSISSAEVAKHNGNNKQHGSFLPTHEIRTGRDGSNTGATREQHGSNTGATWEQHGSNIGSDMGATFAATATQNNNKIHKLYKNSRNNIPKP